MIAILEGGRVCTCTDDTCTAGAAGMRVGLDSGRVLQQVEANDLDEDHHDHIERQGDVIVLATPQARAIHALHLLSEGVVEVHKLANHTVVEHGDDGATRRAKVAFVVVQEDAQSHCKSKQGDEEDEEEGQHVLQDPCRNCWIMRTLPDEGECVSWWPRSGGAL